MSQWLRKVNSWQMPLERKPYLVLTPNNGVMLRVCDQAAFYFNVDVVLEQFRVSSICFRDILKDLLRIHNTDFVFSLRPKFNGSKALDTLDKLGLSNIHFLEAHGFSGSLWILARHLDQHVQVMGAGDNFVHLKFSHPLRDPWCCTVVYINSRDSLKRESLSKFKQFASSIWLPWCIIGDFSEILDASEKLGGA